MQFQTSFRIASVAAIAAAAASWATSQSTPPTAAASVVLGHYDLRQASLQHLVLPRARAAFELDVVLDGRSHRLALHPYDLRAPGFRLLVAGAAGVFEVAAPAPATWRGQLAGEPDTAAAASIEDGELTGLVRLGDGRVWGIQPARRADPTLPRSAHVVYWSGDTVAHGARCGNAEVAAHGHGPALPQAGALKTAEIAIDADYPFFQQNGSSVPSTTNDVTNVMNGVDAIYKRDVEITYKITQILVRSAPDPYTSTNPSTLLSQFGSWWNANMGATKRDVAHLFTGRNSNTGVIGIAFLGVVCNVGSAYGLSVSRFTSNYTSRVGLTAHELGHNWNAPHCSGSACYIMCASLGGCGQNVTRFGTSETPYILSWKNAAGCLDNAAPPVLTSVTPSSVRAFQGGMVTLKGTGLADVSQVYVGAASVASGKFKVVDDQTVTFEAPKASALGAAPVAAATASARSNVLGLSYLATKPPLLYLPPLVVAGFPFDFEFGGDPLDLWVILVAGDQQTLRYQGFDFLLNHAILTAGALDAVGLGSLNLTPPPSTKGITFYSQLATFDETTAKLSGASNVVGSYVF